MGGLTCEFAEVFCKRFFGWYEWQAWTSILARWQSVDSAGVQPDLRFAYALHEQVSVGPRYERIMDGGQWLLPGL